MEPALREKLGQWALVVGGSEGVRACFARRLAGLGFNLIITGYFEDSVAATAASLRQEFGVEIRQVIHDLTQGDPLGPVTPLTDDVDIGLMIYTAGPVAPVPFLDDPLDHAPISMRLNCHGQTAFCHNYGRLMRAGGGGGIIIVGSNAGEFGIAGLASYAAAKAYTKVLAASLWLELKPADIDVLGLILEATHTTYRASQRTG